MFQITVLVEDKKLPKLLWLLDGTILDEPKIRPVRGAKAQRGKAVSSQPMPGGTLAEQVAAMLFTSGVKQADRATLMGMILHAGGKQGSYQGVVTALKKARVLKGHGAGIKYFTVLKPKA